ncbi:MAG: gliding motility-associated-like protein, partial [Flavobacterium sp.]
ATVTFTETSVAGNCAGSYTLIRTWIATDLCGLTTTHSQTVTVQDTTAPTFVETLPTYLTVECSAIPTPVTLTAIDTCGTATVTFTESSVAGNCAGSYTLTRTWIATDLCGLTTTHSQTVTVQDTTAPTLIDTLPTDLSVTCTTIPAIPALTFADSCINSASLIPVFLEVYGNVDSNGNYVITRTWTVSDPCSNTSTFVQLINVNVPDYFRTTTLPAVCDIDNGIVVNVKDVINAQFPGVVTADGIFEDVNNSGALNVLSGIFVPYQLPNGNYTIRYSNKDLNCPKIIEVVIPVDRNECTVLSNCQPIIVHNVLTPNGDSFNEEFLIENITDNICYPENTVEIYNRWGVLVFETKNYNNNTKVFRGMSEGRVTLKQSAALPTGTYYYILNYKDIDGNFNTKNGYLYLTR